MLVTEKGRVGDNKTSLFWGVAGGGGGEEAFYGKTLQEGFIQDNFLKRESVSTLLALIVDIIHSLD